MYFCTSGVSMFCGVATTNGVLTCRSTGLPCNAATIISTPSWPTRYGYCTMSAETMPLRIASTMGSEVSKPTILILPSRCASRTPVAAPSVLLVVMVNTPARSGCAATVDVMIDAALAVWLLLYCGPRNVMPGCFAISSWKPNRRCWATLAAGEFISAITSPLPPISSARMRPASAPPLKLSDCMLASATLMSFTSPSMEMILMPRSFASIRVAVRATGSSAVIMMPSGCPAITAFSTRSCNAGVYCAGPCASNVTPRRFAASVPPQVTDM